MYMSQLVPHILGRDQPMAFISGPSFARELMSDFPTAVAVASTEETLRGKNTIPIHTIPVNVQKLFSSPTLRVYTTDDVVGVEVGGALKNVRII